MVKQLTIRAEAQTVGNLDTLPQLGNLCWRLDSEERARWWGCFKIKLIDVTAKGTHPDSAVVVHGKIVQPEQRSTFPFRKDIADPTGPFVPISQAAARHH